MEISASENVVANTGKKKYTKLSKKHTCGICFRAESLECLSGGIAMIEATSRGGGKQGNLIVKLSHSSISFRSSAAFINYIMPW